MLRFLWNLDSISFLLGFLAATIIWGLFSLLRPFFIRLRENLRDTSQTSRVEAAELLEHFQWLTEEQSRHLSDAKKADVAAEAADVLLYLLQLCDKLDVNLLDAARRKLIVNGEKYPADRARGSSKKYTEI